MDTKTITLGDALTAAANHPQLIEHHNKFTDILKDIGRDTLAVVLFPVSASC